MGKREAIIAVASAVLTYATLTGYKSSDYKKKIECRTAVVK